MTVRLEKKNADGTYELVQEYDSYVDTFEDFQNRNMNVIHWRLVYVEDT